MIRKTPLSFLLLTLCFLPSCMSTIEDVQITNSMWCKEYRFPVEKFNLLPFIIKPIFKDLPIEEGVCLRFKY